MKKQILRLKLTKVFYSVDKKVLPESNKILNILLLRVVKLGPMEGAVNLDL